MRALKIQHYYVDRYNNPLHDIPLQLTAKGCLQFEFDKNSMKFRTSMVKAYIEDEKK